VHFFTFNEFSVEGSSLLIIKLFLFVDSALLSLSYVALGYDLILLCAVLFFPYFTIYMYEPYRKHT
jgi:hypothetical protein